MKLIWATRGRAWGNRFLLDGGFADPLPEYDRAFSNAGDDAELWLASVDRAALRFPDPEGRTDRAGRPIRHEFVVFAPELREISSVATGISLIWNQPAVAASFADIWNLPKPPLLR
ncbi:hypothetical protein C5B85_07945 [Pseudoclavibacter sp. AY1F1]|uniref:hypothetical protein n=1 Tax=Pseudoclavibacter sp. AY1F1 TaxID=2080583 RepID=UPI000CE829FF|nr:hypothetical protein [Pseudoclavibacter sp. AY1F1]PPF45490.1 hypothetical protein C5B85_07945 [Pseudoclavibacter sp. AY1F1]